MSWVDEYMDQENHSQMEIEISEMLNRAFDVGDGDDFVRGVMDKISDDSACHKNASDLIYKEEVTTLGGDQLIIDQIVKNSRERKKMKKIVKATSVYALVAVILFTFMNIVVEINIVPVVAEAKEKIVSEIVSYINDKDKSIIALRKTFLAITNEVSGTIISLKDEIVQRDKQEKYVIRFDRSSYDIGYSGNLVIDKVISATKNNKKCIQLIGYTDTVGGEDSNKRVSEKRAKVVKNKLVSKNINADRIEITPQGENNLPVPTPDGKSELENRRVEIIIKDCDDTRVSHSSTGSIMHDTAGYI